MASGNKGRFSERLKKITLFRRKRNVSLEDNDDNKDSLRRTLLIPFMFFGNAVKNKFSDTPQKKLDKLKKEVTNEEIIIQSKNTSINDEYENLAKKEEKKLKVEKIRDIDINLVKKIHDRNLRTIKKSDNPLFKENQINVVNKVDSNLDKQKLEKEIINLIKKNLVKQINEYELLQGDLFVLKELLNDDVYYNKCVSNIEEIKRLLSRINTLKDKYDYLKDNTSFEYLLEIDDNNLVDKIISLKTLLETNNVEYMVKDYKLLDEYKYLYLKVDKLQEDSINYEKEKNKKIIELKSRDVDFEEFKKKLSNISSLSEGYSDFVNEQNDMMLELNKKIDKIDSYEKIEYSMKGFGSLLKNTFKYLGLLLVSPLKGMIPSIATQTVATKKAISNLNSSLGIDEKKYTVYEAIDYSNEIDIAINDLDYTENLISNTLNDIEVLKRNYSIKFKEYQSKFSEYDDAIRKLNKIENSIVNNKIKIGIIKDRMKVNEKVNSDKMAKVLELNKN